MIELDTEQKVMNWLMHQCSTVLQKSSRNAINSSSLIEGWRDVRQTNTSWTVISKSSKISLGSDEN